MCSFFGFAFSEREASIKSEQLDEKNSKLFIPSIRFTLLCSVNSWLLLSHSICIHPSDHEYLVVVVVGRRQNGFSYTAHGHYHCTTHSARITNII